MLLFALIASSLAFSEEPAPAQSAASACPFAVSDADVQGQMLHGRVLVKLDPRGGELLTGLDLTGGDPHHQVPMEWWMEVGRWEAPTGIAIIVVEDPLAEAPPDLGPAAEASALKRGGSDFLPGAARVDLGSTVPGVTGLLLVGDMPGAGWGAAGVAAFPDHTLMNVAVALQGDLAEDQACREAALARLRLVGPGPRPRDEGGYRVPFQLAAGGTLDAEIPPGFAASVQGGYERTTYAAVRWMPFGPVEKQEFIAYTTSILSWETPPENPGKKVARGTVLGTKTNWTRAKDDPNIEEAFVPGVFGGKPGGVVIVRVASPTEKGRKKLRKIAENATLSASTPDATPKGDAPAPN